MKKYSTLIILFSLIIFFFTACQLKVPIREMLTAYQSIKEAKGFQAEKYAPEELKSAEKLLYTSHLSCKNEDVKKCRQDALKSLEASRLAIKKTLPLLAKDTIKRAVEELKTIEDLNATVYAPKLHATASTSLKEAAATQGQEKYLESYNHSKDSLEASSRAREKCLAQVPLLQEQIKDLKTSSQNLLKKISDEKLTRDIQIIEKNLDLATEAIIKNRLADAAALITTASIKLKEVGVSLKRNELAKKIIAIKSEAGIIKNARGNDFASDELEQLSTSLDEADILLEKDQHTETEIKIKECRQILTSLREKTDYGVALEKLQSIRTLHKKITDQDNENIYTDKLKEADNILLESKKLIEEKSYSSSLQKSVEAETLLNSLTVAMEKAISLRSEKIGPDEETKEKSEKTSPLDKSIYVVRYFPKNKDCLWRISLKVYKDAKLWPRIYLANKKQIKDPDMIFPGQRFIIPPLKLSKIQKNINEKELPKDKNTREEVSPEDKQPPSDKNPSEKTEEKATDKSADK